jgi:hypothetical protein
MIEFDLHGVVGLRVLDASPRDAALVAGEFRVFERALARTPDIVVRFVDRLDADGLQWIEPGGSGFTADGLFLFRHEKRPARAMLALSELDGSCEIACERGSGPVPLLGALVHGAALARGYVPLHASAVVHHGVGVLMTAWANGGKTTGLLALAGAGAHYVADEWVWVAPDGRRMLGVPGRVQLRGWHLDALPPLGGAAPRAKRLFGRALRLLDGGSGGPGRGRALPGARFTERLVGALRRRLEVGVDPERLFTVADGFAGPLDALVLMVRHDRPEMSVEPIEPGELAARAASASAYELSSLAATALAHRFAFPDRSGSLLERTPAACVAQLARTIAGTRAYVLRHPDTCDLRELAEQVTRAVVGAARPAPTRATRHEGRGKVHDTRRRDTPAAAVVPDAAPR